MASPKDSPQRRPRRGELDSGLAGKLAKAEKNLKSGKGKVEVAEFEPAKTRRAKRPLNWRGRFESVIPEDMMAQQMAQPEADEEDYTAPLPPATDADVRGALAESLTARPPTEADADNLWDWIRADEDKGKRFLGDGITTSKLMRAKLAQFAPHLYALDEDTAAEGMQHIGFAGFNPVTPAYAMVHLYLTASVRGRGAQLIPQLLDIAAEQYPGLEIIAQTDDPAFVRLLRGAGFEVTFLLKWAPQRSQVPVDETSTDDQSLQE